MENKKRELEFGKGSVYLKQLIKPLIPYFERSEIEDLQINEFGKVLLFKRDGSREEVIDENISKKFVNILMFHLTAKMGKNSCAGDTTISCMLPINKFRFTAQVDRNITSGVKISIRLNDNELYHDYQDFGLTEKEFSFLVCNISKNKSSCFIIGETGSGKTTFTNLLIRQIPNTEVINVIGDIHDILFLPEQNISEMQAKDKKQYQESFDILMRSNPDRLVIPELTTLNPLAILRAMQSGTKGFLLTMHAGNTLESVSEAFVNNAKLAGEGTLNTQDVSKTLSNSVDFMLFASRDDKGQRRLEKVLINNPKLLEEAKSQGLFGYEQKELKRKRKTKKNKFKLSLFTKILDDYASGEYSVSAIARKYDLPNTSVHNWLKKIKDKKYTDHIK